VNNLPLFIHNYWDLRSKSKLIFLAIQKAKLLFIVWLF
jgi:hypothetical protein